MPKPKFEPKPKFKAVTYRPETTQITSPQNVTPTLLQNIQISPSPSAGDSGGHVTAKIIQIPISTIADLRVGAHFRLTITRISLQILVLHFFCITRFKDCLIYS